MDIKMEDLSEEKSPRSRGCSSDSTDDFVPFKRLRLSSTESTGSKMKKNDQRGIREFMRNVSIDSKYDKLRSTRKDVSKALDELVSKKQHEDDIDAMERRIREEIYGKSKKSSQDADPKPLSDVEVDTIEFENGKKYQIAEKSLFKDEKVVNIFSQKNLFNKYCFCSVQKELCKVTKLPEPFIIRMLSELSFSVSVCKRSSAVQVLLKMCLVTKDKGLVDHLHQVIKAGSKFPEFRFEVSTFEEIFLNFGFIDNLYEKEVTTDKTCRSCRDAFEHESLLEKLVFLIEYFAKHAHQMRPSLNDDLICKFARLFILLLQINQYLKLTQVLRTAIKKLLSRANNWSVLKSSLISKVLASVTDCQAIKEIVLAFPTNSKRCKDFAKSLSFFALHKILDLPTEDDCEIEVVNVQSAACIANSFTLSKFRTVQPFGADVDYAEGLLLIPPCVSLLLVCVGSDLTSTHKSALLTIFQRLKDLNMSIRHNGTVLVAEVKFCIKLATSHLQFATEKLTGQLSYNTSFFRHSLENKVTELLVTEGEGIEDLDEVSSTHSSEGEKCNEDSASKHLFTAFGNVVKDFKTEDAAGSSGESSSNKPPGPISSNDNFFDNLHKEMTAASKAT